MGMGEGANVYGWFVVNGIYHAGPLIRGSNFVRCGRKLFKWFLCVGRKYIC